MNNKFYAPDLSDKRIQYATKYLINFSFEPVDLRYADFVLLGVNPDKKYLEYNLPIFAGGVSDKNVFDYTKNENFAIKNAFLTAEASVSLATSLSEKSLFNSNVLIVGYGRIAKALQKLLSCYTNNITICARNNQQRELAKCYLSNTIDFDDLTKPNSYDFVFNTVPHPVFNEKELSAMNKNALLIDLASFPGGIDKHIAKANELNLVVARGLPGKYSPQTAGNIVAQTVIDMIKEGII
jgi:dipicolinate synthase subunit A